MVTPIRINFTGPGGPSVAGYTNAQPALYDSGAGYGYEAGPPFPLWFIRGVNPDPRLDSGHEVDGGDAFDFRIDVDPGRYDVLVVVGDPALPQDAFVTISDAGSGGVALASDAGVNEFDYLGATLDVESHIRLRMGKAQGAPNTTCVTFVHVMSATLRGAMRAIAPVGTRRLP